MTRREAVARLEALDLAAGSYAVHGSGVLLLHGLIERTGDLDVLARGDGWRRARGLAPVQRGERDPVVRPRPDVEIWGGWLGDDVDALIEAAELVEGWPCVPLTEVLAFKERLDRPKDREHIALLRRVLGLPERGDAGAGGRADPPSGRRRR